MPARFFRAIACSGVPANIAAVGVPHEVQSLSDVRRPDARSAQIERSKGVARSFHVSVNKVEPSEAATARNLLSKHDRRATLRDEVVPCRPKVPLVSEPAAFTCRAERLTGATASPDGSVVGPSSQSKAVAPDSDAGKEMALSVSCEVGGRNIFDAPSVHIAGRYMPGSYEIAQP